MKYRKAKASLRRAWNYLLTDKMPPLAIYGALFSALGVLIFFRLGSLLPGYSAGEVQAYEASLSFEGIIDNPFFAPFTLLVHALTYISQHSLLIARFVSVIFALLVLAAFCWLMQRWYSMRTALLGTLLLGTSAWFLHTARLGTPDVLYFLLLALVACGVWLKHSNNPWVLVLCFVLAGAALYVPGLIWFVIFVMIWEWKQIDYLFKRHLKAVGLGALLFMAISAPLAWAIYRTPELAKTLAGLPSEGWIGTLNFLKNFAEVPLALFARAPTNPEIWLANVPVFDAFAAAMFILGSYLYLRYSRLSRAKIFVPVLAVGWILIALGGDVTLSLIVPFVYIIVATGVGFMINSWHKVFPLNPIAKGVGVALVTLTVIAACAFQLRHYFIAWPNNPETRATFSLQHPRTSDTINE